MRIRLMGLLAASASLLIGTVTPSPAVATSTQQLGPTGTISGTLLDAQTGQPLDGVCGVIVRAKYSSNYNYVVGEFSGCLGASGQFSISGLPPGSYEIEIADVPGAYIEAFPTYDAADLTVAADRVTYLNASLDEASSISGTVTDASTGQPLANDCDIYVTATETVSGYTVSMPGCTDASGQYLIGGLSAGTYYVGVEAAGYEAEEDRDSYVTLGNQQAVTGVDVALQPSGSVGPDLESAATNSTKTGSAAAPARSKRSSGGLESHPRGSVSGHITNGTTGQLLRNFCLHIAVLRMDYGQLQRDWVHVKDWRGCLNGRARFRIGGLAARSKQGKRFEYELHFNTSDRNFANLPYSSAVFEIHPGEVTKHVSSALKEAGRLAGTLFDAQTDQPIANVCDVHLGVRTVCTNKLGDYELRRLPVSKSGFFPVEAIHDDYYNGAGFTPRIRYESTSHVNAYLVPFSSVQLAVEDSSSNPIPDLCGLRIRVFAVGDPLSNRGQQRGCTSSTGTVIVSEVEAGPSKIEVTTPDDPALWVGGTSFDNATPYNVHHARQTDATITLPAGSS